MAFPQQKAGHNVQVSYRNLTNTAVTLGADVIISCDLDIEEIYWYKQKSPDPPEFILRTYSSTYEEAQYENSIFEDKYSVKTNSRLFIRNITADDLGVYYCVKTSEPHKFSNGTRIYITGELFSHLNVTFSHFKYDEFPYSVHTNQTESQQETPWRNLTIITSVLLNVLLIIALIGFPCLDSAISPARVVRRSYLARCLLLSSPVSLQDPPGIVGYAGDSVILPCLYQEKVLKPEQMNVFWRYNENIIVFNIEKGIPSTNRQNAMFKDRIDSFPSKYANGNFSLRLSNLELTDKGQFSCSIPDVFLKNKLMLLVREPPTTVLTATVSTPKQKPDTRNSSIKVPADGIATFLIVVFNCFILHYIVLLY
uniref:Ig-like domain-containing protein n=1 Tax=Cyprinus carpio TaxID=7962 RepID=A0A8C1RW30_CYPCA